MAAERFKLEGVAELRQRLHEFGPQFTRNATGKALRAGARPIVNDARQRVPVRTGALKKAITTRLRRAQHQTRTISLGFRPPTSRRAHFTEYGTRRSRAQPFMRPALDQNATLAFTELYRVLSLAIETEAMKRTLDPDDSDGD